MVRACDVGSTKSTGRAAFEVASRQILSFVIGLGVPFVSILGVLPFTGSLHTSVLGFPFIYFWIFLWFPLTSVCLWISWYAFDRHRYQEDVVREEELD